MTKLETALSDFEERLAETVKSVEGLSKLLKQLQGAARTGSIAQLEKALAAIPAAGREVEGKAEGLPGYWTFDARGHLESGYLGELRQAASQASASSSATGASMSFRYSYASCQAKARCVSERRPSVASGPGRS